MKQSDCFIPMNHFGLRRFREWATANARGRVLEIGIGTALNVPHYPNEAREIYGFDPDAAMLAEIEEQDGRVKLTRARAEALPFPDEFFDCAVGTLVFCTVPDAAQGLREVRRVMKTGAPLRLVEHVAARNSLVRGIQTLVNPLWKPMAGGCNLNRETLRQVEHAGFKILNVQAKMANLVIAIDALK